MDEQLPMVDAAPETPEVPAACCALHQEIEASGTCSRCGAFVCVPCAAATGECLACQQRKQGGSLGLDRETWTVGKLLAAIWPLYRQHWPLLLGAVVLAMGIEFAMTFIGALVQTLLMSVIVGNIMENVEATPSPVFSIGLMLMTYVFLFAQLLLNSMMRLGLIQVTTEAAHGGEVGIGRMFAPFRRFLSALGLLLLEGAIFFVGLMVLTMIIGFSTALLQDRLSGNQLLLLVVGAGTVLALPGLWIALRLSFTEFELIGGGRGVFGAMAASWRITRGQLPRIAAVNLLAAGAQLLGLLLCGVGILAARGYAYLLVAGAWETLRETSRPPDGAAG